MSSARRANEPSPAPTFLRALLACSLMFTLTGFMWFGPGADDQRRNDYTDGSPT
jgi:hypothetical protein